MACGRIPCGRGACGRSALGGDSLFLTPPAGVLAVASSAAGAAVGVVSAAGGLAVAGGAPQALLTSGVAGQLAFRSGTASAQAFVEPAAQSLAVASAPPLALLSSSASGLTAIAASPIAAAITAAAAPGSLAVRFGATLTSTDISIGSGSLALKSSDVAAGIPGNFITEQLAFRGGTLRATISAVPGERYRLLSDRACGRVACGRSPVFSLAIQASRSIAIGAELVLPTLLLQPQDGEIVQHAARVSAGARAIPSPEIIAISTGRFPVRPRVALFTFD